MKSIDEIKVSQADLMDILQKLTRQPQKRAANKEMQYKRLDNHMRSKVGYLMWKDKHEPIMTLENPGAIVKELRALMAEAEKAAAPPEGSPKDGKTPAPAAPAVQEKGKKPAQTPKAEKAGTRGRASPMAGKKIAPSKTVAKEGNPRRANTHGHRSMQIIIDNPGITFESFVEKGGRSKDLHWDIERGHVGVS